MIRSKLRVTKAGWDVPSGFKCRKPEFTEYLGVGAQYDQRKRMGQVYWAVSDGNVVGYMVLAMGSASAEKQADLGIDTYGPVPALVIAYLAVDERHEKQGVGRAMASYAVALANRMAPKAGCRVVLANSEPDVVEFYEKVGFAKFNAVQASGPRGFWRWFCKRMDSRGGKGEAKYVPMYFDIGECPAE